MCPYWTPNWAIVMNLEVVTILWAALKLARSSHPPLRRCYQSIVLSKRLVQAQKRNNKVVHALHKELGVVKKHPEIFSQRNHHEIMCSHQCWIC